MAKTSRLKLVRPAALEFPVEGEGPLALAGPLRPGEQERVQSALALAQSLYGDATLASGESALDHVLGTAAIVSDLKLDGEALAAALLAPIARLDPERIRSVKEHCGAVVAELVEGVARMEQIHALSRQPPFEPLAAGEIVTTGTLTAAMPIKPGEGWSSRYEGLPGVTGLSLTFTE